MAWDQACHWQEVNKNIKSDTPYDWILTDPNVNYNPFQFRSKK